MTDQKVVFIVNNTKAAQCHCIHIHLTKCLPKQTENLRKGQTVYLIIWGKAFLFLKCIGTIHYFLFSLVFNQIPLKL